MRIVGIHGIAHTHLTAPQIEAEWLPALQGGLEEAGVSRIAKEDFTIAAYGALFRLEGTRAGNLLRLTADDIKDEWEKALLLKWWQEAAELSELNRSQHEPAGEALTIQGPDFAGRGRIPELVQRALRQLTKSKFFAKLGGERAILLALRQVREYLYNLDMKRAIQERVVQKVTEDTRIIIGHSLGSIVAYECLCAHPEWNVHTLVTLGSPLGIAPSIFEALTPKPQEGTGVYPKIKQWFNIADQGDIVALEKELAPCFGAVADCLVHNGWESHSATRYLNAKQTGQAIASGLLDS
jgi:PGAP1-like protein